MAGHRRRVKCLTPLANGRRCQANRALDAKGHFLDGCENHGGAPPGWKPQGLTHGACSRFAAAHVFFDAADEAAAAAVRAEAATQPTEADKALHALHAARHQRVRIDRAHAEGKFKLEETYHSVAAQWAHAETKALAHLVALRNAETTGAPIEVRLSAQLDGGWEDDVDPTKPERPE